MLIDITLCGGCELCVEACRETNGLIEGETNVLSAYNRTVIKEYENHMYVRKFCMHCLHPSCVSVCPVGAKPACADACPTGATLFGEREELIRVAHERIANSPQKCTGHVYGQNEFGGTSVLFLSPVSFSKLGFPEDKKSSPLPHLTWRVLSLTPGIVLFGGGFLAGLSWVIKRRMKPQNQEMEDHD